LPEAGITLAARVIARLKPLKLIAQLRALLPTVRKRLDCMVHSLAGGARPAYDELGLGRKANLFDAPWQSPAFTTQEDRVEPHTSDATVGADGGAGPVHIRLILLVAVI